MVILMVFSAYCLCLVIKWVFGQLEQYLDPARATAIKLISSTLRVICVAWVFFTALYQLGVDLTTIVAGLGLTTLALSIGAKDMVNDLIAGVFIVLEGHIRVGDMIDVGGFYGEVTDMNIRTTSVKFINQIKSINNSSMVNVINRSRVMSGCYVTFTVPFDTDIERSSRSFWTTETGS